MSLIFSQLKTSMSLGCALTSINMIVSICTSMQYFIHTHMTLFLSDVLLEPIYILP
jgi:hypothetical protein